MVEENGININIIYLVLARNKCNDVLKKDLDEDGFCAVICSE